MKALLLLLATILLVHGYTLRVSKVLKRPGVNTEQMRLTVDARPLIYHVNKTAVLTDKDAKRKWGQSIEVPLSEVVVLFDERQGS